MTVRVGSGMGARIFPDTDWTEGFELSGEAGRLGGPSTAQTPSAQAGECCVASASCQLHGCPAPEGRTF